jgi:hypothetical protein
MTYSEHVSTEILADHAEGLLGESDSGRVEAHLAECEDCRATSLLLASIPEILAADEVGPMPAVYASRIDAAIADLLVNEPPVPLGPPVAAATPIAVSPIGHDPATNNVVDLASRRKVALAGFRRVSTVAAGMVLLIAGAALGIQTVGKDSITVDDVGNNDVALPAITSLPSAYTGAVKPPKNATKGPRGSMVDPKTGTVFTKSGKILLPNGDVVIPGKKKGEPSTILRPAVKTPAAQPEPEPQPEAKTPSKKSTLDNSTAAQPSKRGQQPQTSVRDPRASTGDATAAPAPTDDPAAQGATETTAPDQKVGVAKVRGDDPSKDPYVSVSGSEYNEDNFAALVMDLVAAARRHASGSGSYEPSSTGSPTPTPTPSAKMPANFRWPTQWAAFFTMPQTPQEPGRGPAENRYQQRVKRCAQQLGKLAIAGDIGRWEGKEATIVVVESPNPDQVDGYVFYGNCSNDRPVTAESAQWTQRVDKPAPESESTPTPARRTGSYQPGYRDR